MSTSQMMCNHILNLFKKIKFLNARSLHPKGVYLYLDNFKIPQINIALLNSVYLLCLEISRPNCMTNIKTDLHSAW